MSSKSQSTGSTDNNQPMPTAHKSGMTRRDLLRRSAVGAATVGAVSTGAVRLDHGPVQNSQAIAPAIAAAGVGGSAAVGWALREYEIIGADDPPEGLTAGALADQVYQAINTRASNDRSTFQDNKNILQGIEHTAYSDAKIEAIEQLNDGEDQSTAQDAAVDIIDEQESTIIKNLINSHTEAAIEAATFGMAVDEHEDLGMWTPFTGKYREADTGSAFEDAEAAPVDYEMGTHELPNGEEVDYAKPEIKWALRQSLNGSVTDDGTFTYDFMDDDFETRVSGSGDNGNGATQSYSVDIVHTVKAQRENEDGEVISTATLPTHEDWYEMIQEVRQIADDVRDGIILWVNSIFDEFESGEFDADDLLTPREQAELTADDENFPQAITDLEALNVAVDYEREAEIYLEDIGATLFGRLGHTGDQTLETGLYDPDKTEDEYNDLEDPDYNYIDGTVYLTYDVSEGSGEWSEYENDLDDGELVFTSQPFADTEYRIQTADGETTSVYESDFYETDDGGEWKAPITEILDNPDAAVESIEFFAESGETNYQTIQLADPFEIVEFTDSDGNTYEESEFERSEPHTDDNYITEEEWQEQQERHEELIEQYEDAQGSDISIPGVEDVLDGEANGLIGIAVVGMVLVSAILSALNPLS